MSPEILGSVMSARGSMSARLACRLGMLGGTVDPDRADAEVVGGHEGHGNGSELQIFPFGRETDDTHPHLATSRECLLSSRSGGSGLPGACDDHLFCGPGTGR